MAWHGGTSSHRCPNAPPPPPRLPTTWCRLRQHFDLPSQVDEHQRWRVIHYAVLHLERVHRNLWRGLPWHMLDWQLLQVRRTGHMSVGPLSSGEGPPAGACGVGGRGVTQGYILAGLVRPAVRNARPPPQRRGATTGAARAAHWGAASAVGNSGHAQGLWRGVVLPGPCGIGAWAAGGPPPK